MQAVLRRAYAADGFWEAKIPDYKLKLSALPATKMHLA